MHPTYGFDGEDAVLWDLVGERDKGFYIDIGANDPVSGCVSKSFYDVGWRGINVEPLGYLAEKFYTEQPDSVTLDCALGESDGWLKIFDSPECSHWATLDPSVASRKDMPDAGLVQVRTLADICFCYVQGPIDWMKIDVEGWETQVIKGGDWAHYRPEFLCIESFVPHTSLPSHQDWEPYLRSWGYTYVRTQGLNRFYRRKD